MPMQCRRCRGPAVIEIRRHNAAFCRDCFVRHVHEQVKRAIASYEMFAPRHHVLVAVSGGKDSLSLWDILIRLGYQADGLYIGLGIDEGIGYSEVSHQKAEAFAKERAQAKFISAQSCASPRTGP